MNCSRCGRTTTKGQPRSRVLLAIFGDECGAVCEACRKRAYSVHGRATTEGNQMLRHLCGNDAEPLDASCCAVEYGDTEDPTEDRRYPYLEAERELPR
jgi:hypothetical protein